jgi:hypothetical protein
MRAFFVFLGDFDMSKNKKDAPADETVASEEVSAESIGNSADTTSATLSDEAPTATTEAQAEAHSEQPVEPPVEPVKTMSTVAQRAASRYAHRAEKMAPFVELASNLHDQVAEHVKSTGVLAAIEDQLIVLLDLIASEIR